MKILRISLASLMTVVLLLAATPTTLVQAATICYVNAAAGGSNTGASWSNAYVSLQSALGSSSCTEIWVATGTYKPTTGVDRSQYFGLKDGVGIYGGFNGTESQRTDRNWTTNVTILSGEIGAAGTADNSYHVVLSGANLTNTAILDGFTIERGNSTGSVDGLGGGVYVFGSGQPVLRNLIISNNTASNDGGGLSTISGTAANNPNSTPTLENVTLDHNTASLSGGGMYIYGSNPTMTNVTLSSNSASYGGGLRMEFSTTSMISVTFNGNSASIYGGGAYIDTSSPTLSNVTFDGNAADWGGGIFSGASTPTLADVTFNQNTAINYGGGMFSNKEGVAVLTRVTFSSNSAAIGGGMSISNALNSSPTLTNVTFSGNSSTSSNIGGGAIYNWRSSPILKNATFYNNSAVYKGGGVYNQGGGSPFAGSNTQLTNATFSGNTAASGGGVANTSSVPTLTNITFSGNSADKGGAVANFDGDPVIKNVIMWGDTAVSGPEVFNNSTTSVPVVTYSVVQGGYTGTGNISADPLLGLLADNGGFTQTIALGAGSSAMDRGTNTGCPSTDQRGNARDSYCDIGSYEDPTQGFSTASQKIYDGWILASSSANTTGGSLNKTALTLNLGDNTANKQYRDILSFDTSGLPDDALVTSVILKIKRKSVVGGGDPVSSFGGFMVDIKKGSFGTPDLTASDFKITSPKYGPFKMAIAGDKSYSINLTSGRSYINVLGITQMRLRFKVASSVNSVANYITLYSGNASASLQPQLILRYDTP